MGKIKVAVILTVCFAMLGLIAAKASAESIILPITKGVYHMICSPVKPEDTDPQVSLEDNLGPYDKTRWRFFRYGYYEDPQDPQASGNKYFELKIDWSDEHNFDFGKAYWIISKYSGAIDIEGAPVGDENRITLDHRGDGWNQIGNIYLQDFTIGMFPSCNLFVVPTSGGILYQLNDPDNPYTHVTLQDYAGGRSYIDIGDDPGEILEAGKGYWLKNILGEDVVLIFDPAGLTSASATDSTDLPSQDLLARVAQQENPPDPPPAIQSSSSSVPLAGGSGGGGGGCFIATAAYGNYNHPNVKLLREFRDRYLLTNRVGSLIVDVYYRYSPAVARFAENRKPIKAVARLNLMPVIGVGAVVSKMNIYGFLIVLAFPFIGRFLFLRRGKGAWGKCRPKFPNNSREGKG
jgi:hypothetical protein